MAILKLEIDTDDIYQGDYDHGSTSFEDLVKGAMRNEITKLVMEKISKEKVEEETDNIREEVEKSVKEKLNNLINEDLAFVNSWGKPTFVGSIEDYIKYQIDERLMKPVDDRGNFLNGCQLDGKKTWIQWAVKDKIDNEIKQIKEAASYQARAFCKDTLKEEMEKFKTQTLKGLVIQQLESVGILNKQTE